MADANVIKVTDFKDAIFVQHNALIEACHRMSLVEMRIMRAFISTLRRDKPNNVESSFVLNINDYNALYGSTDTIRRVKDAIERLFTRSVLLQCDYKDGNGNRYTTRRVAFVGAAGYSDGNIDISFTPQMIGLLENLKDNFTPMPLEVIAGLRTTYGIRLLELLKQYFKIGKRTILISEFRKMFQLEDKYKIYSDFKKRVIKTGVDDINNHTDYMIEYTQIKEQRKVVGFNFTISLKSKVNKLLKFIDIFNSETGKGNKIFVGGNTIFSIDELTENTWYAQTRQTNPISLEKLLKNSSWVYFVGYHSGAEKEFKIK